MRVSKFFKLGMAQADLDFVDVDPMRDTALYVDPYAIEIADDPFSEQCNRILRQFFQELLDAVLKGNEGRIGHLVSNFGEPGDTFLGVSRGEPRGRGVGRLQSEQIVEALRTSQAAVSGNLQDLSESALFVPHISRDKISDLTTNLIRSVLVEYTKNQCDVLGIGPLKRVTSDKPLWDTKRAKWGSAYVHLPMAHKKPVLLVPKIFVRRKISLDSHELYKKVVLEFLQEEHLRASDSLVHVLKNGTRKVYKSELEEKYPFSKDFLYKFISDRPELLKRYRRMKAKVVAPSAFDLDENFRDHTHAQDLKRLLKSVKPGADTATDYHRLMASIVTFVFHPDLIAPVLEQEINERRKRIDILYTNAAHNPFFQRVGTLQATNAVVVPVECKNYSTELGNAEIDQLLGRFSNSRGWLGLLFCRTVSDRPRLLRRCKDAARDGLGHVIVFDDSDVGRLLDSIKMLDRSGVDGYMHGRLNELIV